MLLNVISQTERDTRCLLERTLNVDDVIYLWLSCFKDSIELPATSTTLVDNEFSLGLEWF